MWHSLQINQRQLTDLKAMIITGPPSKGETELNFGLLEKKTLINLRGKIYSYLHHLFKLPIKSCVSLFKM